MALLGSLELQLCDIQGRLFENALKVAYNSEEFIRCFMNSPQALALDDTYDRLQWAGEEYILEELEDEYPQLKKNGELYSNETVYWIGYTYRYWHYYKDSLSKDIYKIADAKIMQSVYPSFHTLDVEMAIDNLIEIHEEIRKDEF
jgi:hypothetical protein